VKRLLVVIVFVVSLVTAYYAGAQNQRDQYSDLQSAWSTLIGKRGTLHTDSKYFVTTDYTMKPVHDYPELVFVGKDYLLFENKMGARTVLPLAISGFEDHTSH